MSKAPKQYNHNGLSGCVKQFRSRATRTLVGIYHGEQAGLDSDCQWLSVCEEHHTCVQQATLASALLTRDPREFCDACREGEND